MHERPRLNRVPLRAARRAAPRAVASPPTDSLVPRGLARWRYRTSFAVVALILLAALGLLPVAVISLAQWIGHEPSARVEVFLPQAARPGGPDAVLHLDDVALDEAGRTLTFRITGYRLCRPTCPADRVVFFAGLPESASQAAAGLPPAASFELPTTTAPVDATIGLPVAGRVLFYPFDQYRLVVALGLERQAPGQPPRFLSPAEAAGQLVVSAQVIVPRIEWRPVPVPAGARQPLASDFRYLGVWAVAFRRPAYLQVLVVLAVLLVGAVATYAALLSELSELLVNTGALIFGVWGIRELLLGNFPPDVTIVDVVLTATVFALLVLVVARVMNHVHAQGRLRVLPRARGRPHRGRRTEGDP